MQFKSDTIKKMVDIDHVDAGPVINLIFHYVYVDRVSVIIVCSLFCSFLTMSIFKCKDKQR